MANDPLYLLLTCGDDDLGILPANEARQAAFEYAREAHRSVTLRDHVTDRVVATVRPGRTYFERITSR